MKGYSFASAIHEGNLNPPSYPISASDAYDEYLLTVDEDEDVLEWSDWFEEECRNQEEEIKQRRYDEWADDNGY